MSWIIWGTLLDTIYSVHYTRVDEIIGSTLMRVLVLQHIACEHPGIFRDLMQADGVAWDAVELDEGEDIPGFDTYDVMMVMGGPMDVW